MAGNSLEIKLPDSFFSALNDIKESVDEGFGEVHESSRSSFYSDNILNASEELQKIVPVFDSKYIESYEKIGASFMKGGAKAFFDYWKIIKKQEDYASKKQFQQKQLAPIVNVKFPDEKKQDKKPSSLESLLSTLLGGGAIALGIWLATQGTNVIAQAGETFLLALGKLKIFDKEAWALRGAKLAEAISKISKPFDWLGDILMGQGRIGSMFGAGVKKMGSIVGNLGKLLAKAGTATIGRFLGRLKFIPFIGTALGFYQAYLRFEKGDYIQGAMELAACLPVVGLPLTIGLNAIQSLWDSGIGGGGVTKMVTSGLSGLKAGGKGLMSIFSKLAVKLLKPLGTVLKRIPFLGSVISFGYAFKNFKDGQYLKGVLNIVSGIANFFPGLGTAIAIGVDILNYFLTETDTGKSFTSSASSWGQKAWEWIKMLGGWVWDGLKALGGWLWDLIKSGFDLYVSAWESVFSSLKIGIRWLWDKVTNLNISFGVDFIKNMVTGAWNNLVDGFKWAKAMAFKIVSWIKKKFLELPIKLLDWTVEAVKGAWEQITGENVEVPQPAEGDKSKPAEVKAVEDELLRTRAAARTVAFQKFAIAAINDYMAGFRMATEWLNKRADEYLNSMPQVDLEGAWSEALKNSNVQVQDNRFNAANQNLKVELDNTNNKLNAHAVSYQEALKKHHINVQTLISKQEIYLAKIATGIDTLTKVVIEKPVAQTSVNPQYSINNNSSSGQTGQTMDPRLNYAGA